MCNEASMDATNLLIYSFFPSTRNTLELVQLLNTICPLHQCPDSSTLHKRGSKVLRNHMLLRLLIEITNGKEITNDALPSVFPFILH